MKKLICAKDVEQAVHAGEKEILIDASTLITPSARDAAANAGIAFREGCAQQAAPAATTNVGEPACAASVPSEQLIYKALQVMLEKGMLGQLMKVAGVEVPYVSESDSAGMIKLVRSNTAKYEPLDAARLGEQVTFNTLIDSGDGAGMNAGFMTIDHSTFAWDVDCQEIYYVVDGTLTVEKDGRVFTAGAGDCLFFKKGAHLTFGTPGTVKVFYVTQ